MSWSREQVICLINEYEKHPVLYNTKLATYKNKHARSEALQNIIEVLKEIRPSTSANEIKNKFGALRSNFLSEHRKYVSSQKSGTGTEDVSYFA